MKIALVRQRYNPFGGAERFVSRALEALLARGVGVTLITRRWTDLPGIQACIVNPRSWGRVSRDRGFARAVQRIIARADFDLVQAHERIPGCDIFRAGDGVHAAWLEEKLRGAGWLTRVLTRCNAYHRYVLRAERELFNHPRLQAVICNSRLVQQQIQQRFPAAADKVHLIYNGVDLQRFQPKVREQYRTGLRAQLGIPEAATVYLYVGSGFTRKGVPLLLDVFPSLPESAHLLVVGHDKALARYRRDCAAQPWGTRVHFSGGVDDVQPYYGAADVLVLPTRYDPFPNVAVEALACGLPLVTTPLCGAAELIRAGDNGFVVDWADPSGWLVALTALQDPLRREARRTAARASVEHLDLTAMSAQLLALYETLTPRKR